MLAVGTPPHPLTKEADLKYIYAAAEELARYLNGYTVVATKSTVPVGTGDEVEKIIRKVNPKADLTWFPCRNFCARGLPSTTFSTPTRIVIGTENDKARDVMLELYRPFAGKSEFCVSSAVRRKPSNMRQTPFWQ